MDIIKVDATDSTNMFLRNLNRQKSFRGSVCVVAREQLSGKGQMGTTWQSNPGENLTCSVFMPIEGLEIKDQFYISVATSLAICDALHSFMIPKISIKWPNDILSDKLKICGVLIENVVKSGRLMGAILGIGLNINQVAFEDLPQAGSLKQISGKHFNIDEVLHIVLQNLEVQFLALHAFDFPSLKDSYRSLLFRKDKPSTFLDTLGNSFVGIIQDISREGKLQVLTEDEMIKDFDLKEIKLLY